VRRPQRARAIFLEQGLLDQHHAARSQVPRIRATWPAGAVIAVVTLLSIGVSVCLAWLLYTCVERRFLAPRTEQPSVRFAAPASV
jgi:peptidoglycan/LPS O-acetylase OafA/YrhL